jgi:hypothetical protein
MAMLLIHQNNYGILRVRHYSFCMQVFIVIVGVCHLEEGYMNQVYKLVLIHALSV